MTTQEKLKELFEEYSVIERLIISGYSEDVDDIRQEQILQEVEQLITKSVVEEILEIPYIKAGGQWGKDEFYLFATLKKIDLTNK